eukprot:m.4324 g.4324  ORF g.4324 m.4324 type:complete len:578 (+) comp2213_c0_seq1:258-1991(+)
MVVGGGNAAAPPIQPNFAEIPRWLFLGPQPGVEDANGGSKCAACTIIVALVEQYAEIKNATASKALSQICDILPDKLQEGCKALVDLYGPYIIEYIDNHETPDVICHSIEMCTGTCQLFPPPKEGLDAAVKRVQTHLDKRGLLSSTEKLSDLPEICKIPGIKYICEIINNFGNNHEPLDDIDTDGYSPIHTLRGADWRGKDCNDLSARVHPGTKPIDNDRDSDSNCNGIFGVEPNSGKTYEELLCAGTDQSGFIALGDSATAHFHIPYQYLSTVSWEKGTFKNLIPTLENEFDWPMLSSGSGFMNTSSWNPDVTGLDNSTYMVMRSRNLCSHRDFQNIGVNGARASSMNDSIQASMARNQETDFPALVMYALIGNDVCNGHPDTLSHMTTPQEMHDSALGTLQFLDTRLPKGSSVFMMGLADGRILYDTMANRIHPIGSLHHDVTTADVYNFLNCLQISPCRGWMNSNETLRNLTTDHANLLSDVLRNLTLSYKPINYELHFFDNPIQQAVEEWVANGGQAWQLIEPVDGFHPSQNAQPLITEFFWRYLEKNYPHLMPPVNPNNAEIFRIFGNQGGY